jgi:hypothetical protein
MAALPLPAKKSGEEKGYENSIRRIPPFWPQKRRGKKCGNAHYALKVVWILRNIVCDRQ